MAHSVLRVVKQAIVQLQKAASWVEPLLDTEEIDEVVLEGWTEATRQLIDELNTYREADES